MARASHIKCPSQQTLIPKPHQHNSMGFADEIECESLAIDFIIKYLSNPQTRGPWTATQLNEAYANASNLNLDDLYVPIDTMLLSRMDEVCSNKQNGDVVWSIIPLAQRNHSNIGRESRHDDRLQFNLKGMSPEWTPIQLASVVDFLIDQKKIDPVKTQQWTAYYSNPTFSSTSSYICNAEHFLERIAYAHDRELREPNRFGLKVLKIYRFDIQPVDVDTLSEGSLSEDEIDKDRESDDAHFKKAYSDWEQRSDDTVNEIRDAKATSIHVTPTIQTLLERRGPVADNEYGLMSTTWEEHFSIADEVCILKLYDMVTHGVLEHRFTPRADHYGFTCSEYLRPYRIEIFGKDDRYRLYYSGVPDPLNTNSSLEFTVIDWITDDFGSVLILSVDEEEQTWRNVHLEKGYEADYDDEKQELILVIGTDAVSHY